MLKLECSCFLGEFALKALADNTSILMKHDFLLDEIKNILSSFSTYHNRY